MYETNIEIGHELYFIKENKVFSNVTLKPVTDLKDVSFVEVHSDGLLFVSRETPDCYLKEEIYDALGNKLEVAQRCHIVLGVSGYGALQGVVPPNTCRQVEADHIFKNKYPYRVTKNLIIQYNDKEDCHYVLKKNGKELLKGKKCALFQTKYGDFVALTDDEGLWSLYDDEGKIDPKIQKMKSFFYKGDELDGEFSCQHKDWHYYQKDIKAERVRKMQKRKNIFICMGFFVFAGFIAQELKSCVDRNKIQFERIENTPASVLQVEKDRIYFDTDGDLSTAELYATCPPEDLLKAGFSLGKEKSKRQLISNWRLLNGLHRMTVKEM